MIPNTGLYEKDCLSFRLVRVRDVSHYYITLLNNGGHCPCCGAYVKKVKDYSSKRISHDKNQIIFYKARRLLCECKKTFYEDNPFSKERKKLSDHLIRCILEDLKRYNHTYLETAQKYGISVTEVIEIFDRHVQIQRKSLRKIDSELYALGGLYVAMGIVYLFFDKIFAVNYRPILKAGSTLPEASFPSTHTLLACVVFGGAILVLGRYLKNRNVRLIVGAVLGFLAALTVIGRLLTGVHWFTDIVGGVLISGFLLSAFSYALDVMKEKRGR